MKFGLDKKTKERIEAKRGQVATCPCCEIDLIPKCGELKVHHWAHKRGHNCDPWWEPETEWHRDWKNKFPTGWQETVRFDPVTNEKHIADIFIPTNELTIEFQNSPITKEELESRESFYKKMIWVVNAKNFSILTFSIQSVFKDIESFEEKLIQDAIKSNVRVPYEIHEKILTCKIEIRNIDRALSQGQIDLRERNIKRLYYQQAIDALKRHYLPSDNPKYKSILRIRDEVYKWAEKNKLLDESNQYYKYSWSWKRKVWGYARLPVFLDMGKELLWIHSDSVVKKVPKDIFISKYSNT